MFPLTRPTLLRPTDPKIFIGPRGRNFFLQLAKWRLCLKKSARLLPAFLSKQKQKQRGGSVMTKVVRQCPPKKTPTHCTGLRKQTTAMQTSVKT